MSDGARETEDTRPQDASRNGRRENRAKPVEKRGGYRGSAGRVPPRPEGPAADRPRGNGGGDGATDGTSASSSRNGEGAGGSSDKE